MATSTNARNRSTTGASTPEAPIRRQRKPSKLKRLIRTFLLVLIVITASVGATLYYTWPAGSSLFAFLSPVLNSAQADADAPEPEKSPAPPPPPASKPIFTALDPFTVTLYDGSSRSRVLHVAITLQVADDASDSFVREYMPIVRDRVLKILSEQHPTYIQSPEGREQLVDALTDNLLTPYAASATIPRIINVLFTAFVVQ